MELCSEQYGLLEYYYLLGLRDHVDEHEPDWGAIHHVSSSSSSTANFPAALGLINHQEFCTTIDQQESCRMSFYSSFVNVGDNNTSFDHDYNSSPPVHQSLHHHQHRDFYSPFGDDDLSADHPLELIPPPPPQQQEDLYSTSINNYCSHLFGNNINIADDIDLLQSLEVPTTFDMGTTTAATPVSSCSQRRNSNVKKATKKPNNNGQPSKNLQAERRRRKRLHERFSMLRSIVPKISKMDRTSIVGDTINYVKELVDRINKLQAENCHLGSNQLTILKDIAAPSQIFVRNSPKFEVERRNGGSNSDTTRIEIRCGGKPGLLMSMVNTIEAELGLKIQHGVISCFNDFAMQASCHHQEMGKTASLSSEEDTKQALLRNAGYGGS